MNILHQKLFLNGMIGVTWGISTKKICQGMGAPYDVFKIDVKKNCENCEKLH